jgi:monofunctional biosynthetic peptidoglycan transglycosylase
VDEPRDGAPSPGGAQPRPPERPEPSGPAPAPAQRAAPEDWADFVPPPEPPPLGARPLPDLAPLPRKRRKPLWRRLLVLLLKAVLAFVLGSLLWVLAYRVLNPPITFTMIGDIVAGHGATRRWMPLGRIDPSMARAVIGAEDARFCLHDGFDFEAIEAAYRRNQRGGRIRGGSTISQQTAKNVFLWQGGGYARKALEAWFTLLIENIWGKRRIMEVYLNVAETGIGTYGVNAGAIRYFKHDASRLSAREAAQIAAVLPLPKKRAGIDPRGYTRRYGNAISRRIGTVRGDGLDGCLR